MDGPDAYLTPLLALFQNAIALGGTPITLASDISAELIRPPCNSALFHKPASHPVEADRGGWAVILCRVRSIDTIPAVPRESRS